MRPILYSALALASSSLIGFGCSATSNNDDATATTSTTSGTGGGATSTSTTSSTGGGNQGGGGGGDCTEEVCDGKDNDCDGEIDNGLPECVCAPGDEQTCYSGPDGTNGLGACHGGTQTCDGAGVWGPCQDEVVPDVEACDGIDNDCDGVLDNDVPDIECGEGACKVTAPGCVAGRPGSCTPGQPSGEVCDGVDNDCDQLTDESFPEEGLACDSGVPGVCAAGTYACNNETLTCVPDAMPVGESCDGFDNDCNGIVDDQVPGTGGQCSTGLPGVCSEGAIQCQNDTIDCFPIIAASAEVCDNLDNNCDGNTDEGDPEGGSTCATGQTGLCGVGTEHCVGGAIVCTSNYSPIAEKCDGVDNDCNGQVDEGSPGAGQTCSCGPLSNTVCVAGQLYCQNCTIEVTCNDGVDEDFNNGADCADSDCALGCAMQTPCAPGENLYVYKSTNIPKSITDNTTVTSTISVSELGTVMHAKLSLDITHTYDGDLQMSLIAPGGTNINMTTDIGGGGDNFTGTNFEDGCTPVASGSAPFTGCFAPLVPFSGFVGSASSGTWTLSIYDDAGGDVGTLNTWSLALCVAP